ncbi:MAG: cytochrome P460 family protein [Rhodocyclaceae bacterium]|nr:cytochrome P460 family protein [Rhodocyclaceae bacterium]
MRMIPMTNKAGLAALAAGLVLGACGGMPEKGDTMAAKPVDGEVPVPEGYRSWPRFVGTVDKAAAGQVREIYINAEGMRAAKGEAFPSGTIAVMEIHAARKGPGDKPLTDAQGRLVKGSLSKIFVMQKGAGWGAAQPAGTLDNGDWVYGAWEADGRSAAKVDFKACRACHAPLATTDYIARYDEHFGMR